MSVSKAISALGFVGYMPVAPGTFGTLSAMAVVVFLKPSMPALVAITLICSAVGIAVAGIEEKKAGRKDPGYIVIDEFAGYMVSVLFLPPGMGYIVSAFILFRVFDIIKPPPIRSIERAFKGGFGIVADDIAAGVYTNLVLEAWRFLSWK